MFNFLRRKEDKEPKPVIEEGEFKEVAFNSKTHKTLIRDGDEFLVVVGTNKSFVDTLRQLKYLKFTSMEEAIAFFKVNGEQIERRKSVRNETDSPTPNSE